MKKIRFVNPIKECLDIQGKGYTIGLIAIILAATILAGVSAWAGMPICATLYAIMAVGTTIGFGLWFGTEKIPNLDEDWD